MADPQKELPATIPMPNLDLILRGDPAGKQELVDTLRAIITAFNQYVVRKGA